jgi:AcrR family transcriptional regulator
MTTEAFSSPLVSKVIDSMAGRPKKYDDPRQVILDKTDELFAKFGFHKTTLDDIMKATQMARASIYKIFPSKETILTAIVQRFLGQLFGEMQTKIALGKKQGTDPLVLLKEVLLFKVHYVYGRIKRHFHGESMMVPPPTEKVAEVAPIIERLMRQDLPLISQLLEEAALGQSLEAPSGAWDAQAETFYLGLASCFPPFVLLMGWNETELDQKASLLLDTLIAGAQRSKTL